jgi:hypothetical protein
MLPGYAQKTNIGVGVGLVLNILGGILSRSGSQAGAILGLLLSLAGTVIFIWGCWNYAEGKGHHGAWGLLGLLSCIGLLILVFFPDKHK